MSSEDNKDKDTTRNTNPQGNNNPGDNKSTESKESTQEQIGKVVENVKPYAQKTWEVTQDLASFVKDKAPGIIAALKEGFEESRATVQKVYDQFKEFQKNKEKLDSKTTTTTTTTKTTDTTSKTNTPNSSNKHKNP